MSPRTPTHLIDALQAAIDQGQSAGEFSDQQSITESVFELISGIATPENPLDPLRRYSVRLPVLLQSTFVMPDFRGHLKAFKNNAGAAQTLWDAAQKLQDRVTGAPAPMWNDRTFPQLHASATPSTIGASAANIKRRIFTTNRNGVFLTGTDAQIVTQPDPGFAGVRAPGPDRAVAAGSRRSIRRTT